MLCWDVGHASSLGSQTHQGLSHRSVCWNHTADFRQLMLMQNVFGNCLRSHCLSFQISQTFSQHVQPTSASFPRYASTGHIHSLKVFQQALRAQRAIPLGIPKRQAGQAVSLHRLADVPLHAPSIWERLPDRNGRSLSRSRTTCCAVRSTTAPFIGTKCAECGRRAFSRKQLSTAAVATSTRFLRPHGGHQLSVRGRTMCVTLSTEMTCFSFNLRLVINPVPHVLVLLFTLQHALLHLRDIVLHFVFFSWRTWCQNNQN